MKKRSQVKFTNFILSMSAGGLLVSCAASPQPAVQPPQSLEQVDGGQTIKKKKTGKKESHTTDKTGQRGGKFAHNLPERKIMSQPGGPVNKPVPGTGTIWPEIRPQDLVGKWSLSSTRFGTENYEITLNPVAENAIGTVTFTGKIPFPERPAVYWRYDDMGHIFFLGKTYQTAWRARRYGPKHFQASLGGSAIYELKPLTP